MGLIREPKDVDFYVDPTPLSVTDKSMIREAIAYYNATGRVKHITKTKKKRKVKSAA